PTVLFYWIPLTENWFSGTKVSWFINQISSVRVSRCNRDVSRTLLFIGFSIQFLIVKLSHYY
ncbi:MAG: hypothetical protein KA133_05860, partial [Flavobacterium sp.]|nr:hypothetical protein [Flavobacterium sp.]